MPVCLTSELGACESTDSFSPIPYLLQGVKKKIRFFNALNIFSKLTRTIFVYLHLNIQKSVQRREGMKIKYLINLDRKERLHGDFTNIEGTNRCDEGTRTCEPRKCAFNKTKGTHTFSAFKIILARSQ